jgi:heme exporter protein B
LRYLRTVLAIVAKDVAAELHSREVVGSMAVFAVLAVLIFSFGLDLRGGTARAAAPGILWATVAFAGTLGLSRSLARERQSGCVDGLLLAPVDRSAIFFGKALGNLTFVWIVEIFLVPLLSALLDASLVRPAVWLVMALGTVGYAALGTLLAAMAVNTRAREVLLPVLLLPLAIPVLLPAVQATGRLLDGAPLAEVEGWVGLLVGYDLVVVAVSMLTFGTVLEE